MSFDKLEIAWYKFVNFNKKHKNNIFLLLGWATILALGIIGLITIMVIFKLYLLALILNLVFWLNIFPYLFFKYIEKNLSTNEMYREMKQKGERRSVKDILTNR